MKKTIKNAVTARATELRNKKGMAGGAALIVALIEVCIGLALLPTLRGFVNASLGGDANDGVIKLVTTLYIFAIVGVAAATVYFAFRKH